MVHYQAAFKLSPSDARALERARAIYREMGNLEMVATLLGLELKVTTDAARKAEVEGKLGVALLDLGKRDQALPHLEAAAAARPDDGEIRDALAAANYDREDWLGEAERLTKQAEKADSSTAARIMLRVARIYRMEVPADPAYVEALQKVVANEPQHEQANFLLEGALGAQKRFDDIVKLHENRAFACADEREQAELYRRFASMWALRWNDVERSAHFYRKALQAYYGDGLSQGAQFLGHLAAFGFLREIEGAKGEWAKLLAIADLGLALGADRGRAGDPGHAGRRHLVEGDARLGEGQGLLRAGRSASTPSPKSCTRSCATPRARSSRRRSSAPTRSWRRSRWRRRQRRDRAAGAGGAAPSAPPPATAEAPATTPVKEPPQKGNGKKKRAKSEEPMDAPREEQPEDMPPAPSKADEPAPASEPEVRAKRSRRPAAGEGDEPAGDDRAPSAARREDSATTCARRWTPRTRRSRPASTRASRRGGRSCRPTRRCARRAASCSACTPRPSAGTRSSSCIKEEVEKLADTTPDEKVALLYEMVDVYKTRLKLDTMVVNTYNAILALRPTEQRALDALAAQYEHMKRWPDLIGVLQKKAPTLTDGARAGRALPAHRQPVPGEVLERRRGDQGVREGARARRAATRRRSRTSSELREAPRLGEADRRPPEARSSASPNPASAAPSSSRSPSWPRRS